MANQYQESLLNAMDILVENRVNQIATDKTITATIITCTNILTNEYKVSYDGGSMYAYGQEGASYSENTTVYVLVPEGDFTKRKIIVGKANLSEDDNNISFVSSALSDYNLIGKNVILDKNNNLPYGLFSYLKEDYKLLYKYGTQDNTSLININVEEFSTYIKEAEAILIEASFKTRLPRIHQTSKTGTYGLEFVLAFKNTDATAEQYNVYLPKIEGEQNQLGEYSKNSKEALEELWNDQFISFSEKQEKTKEILNRIEKYLKSYKENIADKEKEVIENFIKKTKEILDLKNLEDVFTVLSEMNNEESSEIKYLTYTLDTNSMTGNPFLYYNYSNQYSIFPIDVENFLYIDSILAFSKNFEQQDDTVNAKLWGEDIFIDELEIYGLKKITSVNGQYKLSINTPKGTIFKTIDKNETLDILGRITYQENIDLSDATTYYWFIEDNRITSSSELYQMYGGAGWRWLKSKTNKHTLTVYDYENKAYENKYLCVAVYKEQLILKSEFIIYNDAVKRNISIESDLGLNFSFDRGIPTMTCLIDGKSEKFEENVVEGRPDNYFSFYWSKIDEYGQTINFNKTYKELEQEYEEAIKNADEIGYSGIAALKNQMLAMQGVEFNKNILKYPVKGIDSKAVFKCSVYTKDGEHQEEYFIGSSEIILQNSLAATPTDYYILITNGDQVFQYSESGVAPNSERYTDPLEILPLSCHFYDPAGLEVNTQTYQVKWKVPLENSMIVVPQEGMETNPSNNKKEWYTLKEYPLMITESYDYQALNNQITAIIDYNGQQYTQDTTFLFAKVGDNGTNGTDVVCKISPIKEPKDTLLALELIDGEPQNWNNGQNLSEEILKFQAYNRNELLELQSVSWSMAGGNSYSKNMNILSGTSNLTNGIVSWSKEPLEKGIYTNQIVRGQTSFEQQDYYAFYPIPTVNYVKRINYRIKIDKTKTLKYVIYNADGRNPLYNKNQGVSISVPDSQTKFFVWSVQGGIKDSVSSSNIKIMKTKDGRTVDGQKEEPSYRLTGTNLTGVYVVPFDIYDGAYSNNVVKVKIYKDETTYNNNGIHEVEITVPIHLSLNIFGLASLNAWDGNHVEINEDENYILAPQIGAGEKDSKNRFTGVLMGASQTYDSEDKDIGLLGFSEGKQSIFLNSKDGSATFGLPEDQASAENNYTEGRIKLVPGGVSEIGMWKIGSRLLYNISDGTKPLDKAYTDQYTPNFQGIPPIEINGQQYRGYSVPHDASGILMSADPAYLSIKGKQLTAEDDIYFSMDALGVPSNKKNGKSLLYPGDSLEIQLDPNQSSLFGVLQHTRNEKGKETRLLRVGIDYYGRFFTNALKDSAVGVAPGPIMAFGKSVDVSDPFYQGLSVETGEDVRYAETLIKFFKQTKGSSTSTVYISGSDNQNNEYSRPLALYGKEVSLFAEGTGSDISETSTSKVKISRNSSFIGTSQDYLSLGNIENKLESARNFEVNIEKMTLQTNNRDIEIPNSRNFKSVFNGNYDETIKGDTSLHLERTLKIDKPTSLTMNIGGKSSFSEIYSDSNGFKLTYRSTLNSQNYLQMNSSKVILSSNGDLSLYGADSESGIGLSSGRVHIRPSKSDNSYMYLTPNETYLTTSGASIGVGDGQGLDSGGRSTNGIKLGGNTVVTNVFSVNGTGKFYSNMSVAGTLYANSLAPNGGREVRIGEDTSIAGDIWLDDLWDWVGIRIKKIEDRIGNDENRINELQAKIDNLFAQLGNYVTWAAFRGHYHYLDNGHRETAQAGDPLHSHDYLVQHDTGYPLGV